MSSQKQVSMRDLVEEAKKRIVFLIVCVVGLSYLMSLTSSSVLINLPAAASLIILVRYFSLDFEMRRKAASYNSKPSPANTVSQNKHPESHKVIKRFDWRRKVNSPVVEDALDKFTRHLVSEWVTDLWYSRITPDKEGPEELVQIINGVFGEFSGRMRNINLIDLLTRDVIGVICTHLELFRAAQVKIDKQQSVPLSIEHRDFEIRRILAAENKLHPALFSAEAEHKVLQCVMEGLISFTFRHEDLQCSFFRFTVRELLACAVMRPVLNLANPRFINERIESVVVNMSKAKSPTESQGTSQSKPNGSPKISSDHFNRFLDPSGTGVELVQLKTQSKSAVTTPATDLSKDPLLSIDARSTRSWGSLPLNSQSSLKVGIQRYHSGGEWGDVLDLMSHRKKQALAPENFENMWTKGRNYKKKEGEKQVVEQHSQHSVGKPVTAGCPKPTSRSRDTTKINTDQHIVENSHRLANQKKLPSFLEDDDDDDENFIPEVETGGSSSNTSEDDETSNVTGLGSPGTKVWDGKSNRNLSVSHIHHPLENPDKYTSKRSGRRHLQYHSLPQSQSGRKRSRVSSQKLPVWQEVERTTFLSGDGQDILSSHKGQSNLDESSDDSDMESLGRSHSGSVASSSVSYISTPGSHSSTVNSLQSSMVVDTFFKLRCEVLGANIVKSGSKTFAVYSISVTDVNNNSWSIKRRFRHFEELHRRLKFFPEYNLHLPPKHFLSTGLDVPVIRERCKLLDVYLKKLLQLPTVSGSIEVWDFLSVDSQTYIFSNSFSIVETLSVDLENKPPERSATYTTGPSTTRRESLGAESSESLYKMKDNLVADDFKNKSKEMSHSPGKTNVTEKGKSSENSGSGPEKKVQNIPSTLRNLGKKLTGRENDTLEERSSSMLEAASDPTLPTEWVPPNLSVPILDLVDVIFQLQDGGWIRRKAFWVAKQVLQLGMGDAFDDWLMEKIQLLRRGSLVASGVNRVEQILWPDGIFLTKHPKRRQPPPSSQSPRSPSDHKPEDSSPAPSDEQKQAEEERAKFVYELMIDKAPAPIVGLVGRKEYEQCAKDLYFFIQSSVCLKQLAFDLVELLLLSSFPELDYVFRQVHEEKHKFGEFKEQYP